MCMRRRFRGADVVVPGEKRAAELRHMGDRRFGAQPGENGTRIPPERVDIDVNGGCGADRRSPSPEAAEERSYSAARAPTSSAIMRSMKRRMVMRLASAAMSTRPASPSSVMRACCASTISLSSTKVGAISR